jgi:hypothetical protein
MEHSLKELCPTLTPEELNQAEENLERYVKLAVRVFQRISQDPKAHRRLIRSIERENAKMCTTADIDADDKKFESNQEMAEHDYIGLL